MRKFSIVFLVMSMLTVGVLGQKKLKPWGDWSQKDAQKVLDDSPWGQTQTDSDTSQMFFSPTSDPNATGARGTSNDSSRLGQGATNQVVNINYHVRFFTAKPIRQALVRMIEVAQTNLSKDQVDRLTAFTNVTSTESVIVTVAFDATDQRAAGPVMQAFGTLTTDALKNVSYLQRKDGQKVYLTEYVLPGKDGFGARFIFPRQLDGQPFLTADSGEVRFYTEYNAGKLALKLDRRFKVADMMYEGQLEY